MPECNAALNKGDKFFGQPVRDRFAAGWNVRRFQMLF
jgi:hypothetical protein